MSNRHIPYDYEGVAPAVFHMKDDETSLIEEMRQHYQFRLDFMKNNWKKVVGPRLCEMSRVTGLYKGKLKIRVTNSSLLSLFSQIEKEKLLVKIAEVFPNYKITDLEVKLG